MGPLAERYFFTTSKTHEITNKRRLKSFTKAGLEAYRKGRSLKTHRSLFLNANRVWKAKHEEQWYGTTHQSIVPSEWGRMNLGLNLCNALTKHIRTALDKCVNSSSKTENKIFTIIGRKV